MCGRLVLTYQQLINTEAFSCRKSVYIVGEIAKAADTTRSEAVNVAVDYEHVPTVGFKAFF